MKNHTNTDIPFILDSAIYFVAKHYGISIADVRRMSEEDFEDSFVFAAAAERIKAEEIDKATKDAKSGTDVGPSKGQPFPFE